MYINIKNKTKKYFSKFNKKTTNTEKIIFLKYKKYIIPIFDNHILNYRIFTLIIFFRHIIFNSCQFPYIVIFFPEKAHT